MASEKNNLSPLPVPEGYEVPVGCAPVALYSSTRAAHEAGLAVLAMGEAYWLLPHEEGYLLCVAEGKMPLVRHELEVVSGMSHRRHLLRSTSRHYEEFQVRAGSFLIYALILISFFLAQHNWPLLEAGRVDAVSMVDQREWWRALTALTLHADVVHLASNLVAGIGFACLLARFFGAAAAWLLILFAGGLGNALNAWVYYPEAHFSIGASTAVFAALGMITGVGLWIALVQTAERWTMPRWLLPAFGGLTLLGLLGLGEGRDGQIDVAAHISGFLCGCLAGVVCAPRQSFFIRIARYRMWVGGVAIALLGLAWSLSLRY